MGGEESSMQQNQNNNPVNGNQQSQPQGNNQPNSQNKFIFSQQGQLLNQNDLQRQQGSQQALSGDQALSQQAAEQLRLSKIKQTQAKKILNPMARDEQINQNKPNKVYFGKFNPQASDANASSQNMSQSYLMNNQSYLKKLAGSSFKQPIFYENSTYKQNPQETANQIQQVPPQNSLQEHYAKSSVLMKQSQVPVSNPAQANRFTINSSIVQPQQSQHRIFSN